MWGKYLADLAASGFLASFSEYIYKNIYDNILLVTPLPLSLSLSPPTT